MLLSRNSQLRVSYLKGASMLSIFLMLCFSFLFIFSVVIVSGCSSRKNNFLSMHKFIENEAWAFDDSPEMIGKFKRLLQGLNYIKIITLPPHFIKVSRKRSYPFPQFINNKSRKPNTLLLTRIHFMQDTVWDEFHNSKYDVVVTANQLKNI